MFGVIASAALVVANVDAGQIATGELLGQRVAVRGVVGSVLRDDLDDGFIWIVLRTPGGKVCASAPEATHPLDEFGRLRDAEVELTGSVQRFAQWRRFLGYQLMMDGPTANSDVAVIVPPPANPFAAPPVTDAPAIHRRTARGVVLAATSARFFLKTDAGNFLPVAPVAGSPLPKVGERVAVSGFVEQGQLKPHLVESLWRTEFGSAAAAAETVTPVDVRDFRKRDGTRRYANEDLFGKTIRIAGTLEDVSPTDSVAGFRLDCGGETVFVDLSGYPRGTFQRSAPLARLEVVGICYADFENDQTTVVFPRFRGFTVIPRTPDDVRVIRPAPWWTVSRLLIALAILLAAALGLFAWTVSLKIVSGHRAKVLAQEKIASARAEAKVEERTGLAVELHDSLSQTLTGVALQIDAALGADGDSARKSLSTARQMLASCRQELKGCLWDLRNRSFEEKDMAEAIKRALAPHLGPAKLTVRFNVPRECLSEASAHALLRIVRELAVNAVSHGKAKRVDVGGEFHDGTIFFSVKDDGIGFDAASAPGPAQGHFGLQGVRERLKKFNGTLRCDSEPGRGTQFTITLKPRETTTE